MTQAQHAARIRNVERVMCLKIRKMNNYELRYYMCWATLSTGNVLITAERIGFIVVEHKVLKMQS